MIPFVEWLDKPAYLNIGIWISALLTLAVFSFLIQDNVVFRLAEHIFAGVSIGYLVSTTFHQDIIPQVWDPLVKAYTAYQETGAYGPFLQESILTLIPFIMGLFLFLPFIAPKFSWLMGFPFAYYIGWGAGVSLPATIQANILAQMYGSVSPFVDIQQGTATFAAGLGMSLSFIGMICTLAYFFFSLEHKGVLAGMSRLGIWFVMIGFGAAFGYTVMARVSLLIGRILFLLIQWLHILPAPT